MNEKELIHAGRLAEARHLLVEKIKRAPADREARNLLFQLFCFLGEWEKALRHLDVLALTAAAPPAATFGHYRNLVQAEKARLAVELGGAVPEFLSEPPGYLREFLKARALLASGSGERFLELVGKLEEEAPVVQGEADGVPFVGFYDVNPGTFPVLEAFVHDRYLWFPFASLRELTVRAPVHLLDLLWIPATLVTFEGLTTDCYLPVLYQGSAAHGDDRVRMGRLTDWVPRGGWLRGVGQHLLQVGEEEKGLLELRQVTFTRSQPEQK